MTKIFLFILVILTSYAYAQPVYINITPKPAQVLVGNAEDHFTLDKHTVVIVGNNQLSGSFNYLNEYLNKYYGFQLKRGKTTSLPLSNFIELNIISNVDTQKDKYSLNVSRDKIAISSSSKEGVFYGIQSLLQLIPVQVSGSKTATYMLPVVSITDYPRFAYRGMHLDVSRHFFPPAFIKQYIDYLALHKFNNFHWHLSDDQGWRIEIKKYPLLTSVGGYRNGTIIGRYPGTGNDGLRYGGFYTQIEIREIVRYAADRYITIIPEIDMPGHASAAIAAYPALSCFPAESTKVPPQCTWSGSTTGKQVQQTWGVFEDVFSPSEYTFKFLENVLDEVIQLFPSGYIHIGGDECPKTAWKRSPFCQKLIKSKSLKDEHGLQSYFIQRIGKYVNSKGRKIIGWDEILEGGLAPNATVMSWRGEEGGIAAAKEKHNVIMTPQYACYFDHAQTKNDDSVTIGGYLPLEKVYAYEPVPKQLNGEQATYVMGAQGNVWTEYITNPQKVEYMIFPRLTALSEVLWSSKENRDWKSFEKRLPEIINRYEQWGAHYSTSYYGLQSSILPAPDHHGILWKLETKKKNSKIIVTNVLDKQASIYSEPVWITAGSEYTAQLTDEQGKAIGSAFKQNFTFNKATGKAVTLKNEPEVTYPGSGAFTLVNGVITQNKLSQSSEWLGFLGKDLEAILDLEKEETISKIRLGILKQEGSWIYPPASVEFFTSPDGITFKSEGKLVPDASGKWPDDRHIEMKLNGIAARYIKVLAKNFGIIPQGMAGAGTAAWLFADEIEVE